MEASMYSDTLLFVVLSQTDNFVSKGPPQCLPERPPVWSDVYSGFFPNFEVSFCQLLCNLKFINKIKEHVPGFCWANSNIPHHQITLIDMGEKKLIFLLLECYRHTLSFIN